MQFIVREIRFNLEAVEDNRAGVTVTVNERGVKFSPIGFPIPGQEPAFTLRHDEFALVRHVSQIFFPVAEAR